MKRQRKRWGEEKKMRLGEERRHEETETAWRKGGEVKRQREMMWGEGRLEGGGASQRSKAMWKDDSEGIRRVLLKKDNVQ